MFPWGRLVVAILIGLPALAAAFVCALALEPYFGPAFDTAPVEINGRTFGTTQTDVPILFAMASTFGAVAVFCARRLWIGVREWRRVGT
jgi:hypothetical protein